MSEINIKINNNNYETNEDALTILNNMKEKARARTSKYYYENKSKVIEKVKEKQNERKIKAETDEALANKIKEIRNIWREKNKVKLAEQQKLIYNKNKERNKDKNRIYKIYLESLSTQTENLIL